GVIRVFSLFPTRRSSDLATRLWLVVTGLLGAAFVGIELYEFAEMIAEGATPQRSGYLSAFFTLVGTHGLHVSFGIVWIAVMLVRSEEHTSELQSRENLAC